MGARFYQEGDSYFFESNDGLDMELDTDNYWVWLNRSIPLMDMAQVTDPRDDESWTWFRYDMENDDFNDLDMIARKVGSVILRQNPTEDVELVFHNRHQIRDGELEGLLDDGKE